MSRRDRWERCLGGLTVDVMDRIDSKYRCAVCKLILLYPHQLACCRTLLAVGASRQSYSIGNLCLSSTRKSSTLSSLVSRSRVHFVTKSKLGRRLIRSPPLLSLDWYFHTHWQTFADRAVENELSVLPRTIITIVVNGRVRRRIRPDTNVYTSEYDGIRSFFIVLPDSWITAVCCRVVYDDIRRVTSVVNDRVSWFHTILRRYQ